MLSKAVLLLAAACVSVQGATNGSRRFTKSADLGNYSFEQYMRESGKKYSDDELATRRNYFEQNMKRIMSHNADPKQSYKLGVNMFTASSPAELQQTFGGNKHALSTSASNKHLKKVGARSEAEKKKVLASLPASKDWREEGVVTPVKDQGHCGSCWAHAAVETIESFLAINTGVLTEISQQELVACMPNNDNCGGTGGCEGATATLAFDYLSEYGLPEMWQYGYESATYWLGNNGACLRDMTYGEQPAMPRAVTADGYDLLPRNDYVALMETIANVGPVAINVDASEWHAYEGGVFSGCPQDNVDINHVVQLVGYGTCPESGKDYWLVRNSWTSQWGVEGYIKLERQDGYCGTDSHNGDGVGCDTDPKNVTVCGQCGILYDSSYPINTRLWEA